jgi:hypothetical protein
VDRTTTHNPQAAIKNIEADVYMTAAAAAAAGGGAL